MVWEHSQAVSHGESMAFARELGATGAAMCQAGLGAGSSSDGVPKAAALTGLATGKASFKPSALVQEEQFSTAYVSNIWHFSVWANTCVGLCPLPCQVLHCHGKRHYEVRKEVCFYLSIVLSKHHVTEKPFIYWILLVIIIITDN